jgi:shikimate kinase
LLATDKIQTQNDFRKGELKMCNIIKIIEFNGLPGSGKSTISEELIKQLELKDKVVLSEQNIFEQSKPSKKLLELGKSLYTPKSIKLNYALLRLGIKASIRSKSSNNLKSAIKIIRYNFILIERISRGDFDVICLSEGFMQFIFCIYDGLEFFKSSELEVILHEISNLHNDLLVINCRISKEKTLQRLKERNSVPNTVDLMGEKERIEFIECREKNMKEINKLTINTMKLYEIDTLDDIDKNVSSIIALADI